MTKSQQNDPLTVAMPKLPEGTDPVFSVGDLVGGLLGDLTERWVQLDDDTSVRLKAWAPDSAQIAYMEAERNSRKAPAAYYRAARQFILAAVVDEHRATVETWLDDSGLPGTAFITIANKMFAVTQGIPFDEPPESGGS